MNDDVNHIVVESGMTDNQIKERLMSQPNGEYCCWICRNCGAFSTSPEGNTKNARIVSFCKNCAVKHLPKIIHRLELADKALMLFYAYGDQLATWDEVIEAIKNYILEKSQS